MGKIKVDTLETINTDGYLGAKDLLLIDFVHKHRQQIEKYPTTTIYVFLGKGTCFLGGNKKKGPCQGCLTPSTVRVLTTNPQISFFTRGKMMPVMVAIQWDHPNLSFWSKLIDVLQNGPKTYELLI